MLPLLLPYCCQAPTGAGIVLSGDEACVKSPHHQTTEGSGRDGGGPGSLRPSPFICIRIVGQRPHRSAESHLNRPSTRKEPTRFMPKGSATPRQLLPCRLDPRDARSAIGRGLQLRGRRRDASSTSGSPPPRPRPLGSGRRNTWLRYPTSSVAALLLPHF